MSKSKPINKLPIKTNPLLSGYTIYEDLTTTSIVAIKDLVELIVDNSDLYPIVTAETFNRITGDTYLQNQINNLIINKSDSGHTHNTSDLNNDSGFITSADIPAQIITENIPVRLSNNKTLGKYVNGQTIMSSGMTVTQLFKDIALEALAPSVTLTTSTSIAFNQTSISNILNFTYTINSLGATIGSVSLDWRRGGTGNWEILSTNTGLTSYTHNYTDTTGNTSTFNYKYVVTDSAGGIATGTTNITPSAYVAPTYNTSVTQTKELGNKSTLISGTITPGSTNCPIQYRHLYYSVNNTNWYLISGATITGNTVTYTHDDPSLLNSTTVYYRLSIIDTKQTTNLPIGTVTYVYKSVLGYVITLPDLDTDGTLTEQEKLTTILGIGNNVLTNSKVRTISNVQTPTINHYTYYAYKSTAGDVVSILQSPATETIGNWTKQTDISGFNLYGANVTYRIYKTNQPGSFSNIQTLIIT